MKKLILSAVLVASFSAKSQTKDPVKVEDKTWRVTSTCATISKIKLSKNASIDELKKKVQDENLSKCGVVPKRVNVTVSTK